MASNLYMLFLFVLLVTLSLKMEAGPCNPSGQFRAKRHPPGTCIENDVCCIPGDLYNVYNCSPPVTTGTKAILALASFEKGGDGTTPAKCDHTYHSDDTPVVALSTGWFSRKARCNHAITISANGTSVTAKVVDVCDSTQGCDAAHNYLPPCPNNVVVASMAVWKALDVHREDWGYLDIVWSDDA